MCIMSVILDSSTITKIAKLSKISSNPNQEFLDTYTPELESILEYAEQLKLVDTTGVNFLDGARTISVSQLSEDIPNSDELSYQKVRTNIINNFPSKQGDLLVVSGIFE